MEKLQGSTFKLMLESGANNLTNNSAKIDALNVFPVPDGDTGTNMNLTFTNGVKEVKAATIDDIGGIAKVLSRGLLMGARGNSGVILSQIFRGFAAGVKGLEEVDALTFIKSFVQGYELAYKAVMRPVEGTILTVIREGADYTLMHVEKNNITDIVEVMRVLCHECRQALSRTPDLLPVLKEVGVVDSGGAGLCAVFDGFLACLEGNPIALASASEEMENANEEVLFGYCTEYILQLKEEAQTSFSLDKLTKALSHIGDSLKINQEGTKVNVHLHTLVPGEALNLGQKYGEFTKLKIDNLANSDHTSIFDTIEENKEAKDLKEFGLITVSAGEGLDDYFKELRVDLVVSGGQTMNPSTEDFLDAIKKVDAKNIIILPNNSNIVMAASQAASLVEDKHVVVIPTKTIPQGISACIMFNPDVSLDENIENMTEAVSAVRTGQVTYAIKDTTYDGLEIHANDYMGIKEKDIIISNPSKMDTTKQLLNSIVDEDSEIITLIVGEDVTDDEASEIADFIEASFEAECEVIHGKQPVYSFFIGVE